MGDMSILGNPHFTVPLRDIGSWMLGMVIKRSLQMLLQLPMHNVSRKCSESSNLSSVGLRGREVVGSRSRSLESRSRSLEDVRCKHRDYINRGLEQT